MPRDAGKQLRIRLLGGFSVSVAGGEVAREWRLRKAKILVEMLALAPERRLNSEQTAELLWPDRSPASARNNLHQALHEARRALDCVLDGHRALRLRDGVLALCPDEAPWIDVVAFTNAAATARAGREPKDYREALELYTGELLPEHRHEEWTVQRREALRELHLALGVELAELETAAGEAAAAIEALHSVLDEAPLYEPAHRALMRTLASSGRRQEALAQFQELKRRLRREFEDAPDERTSQVYQQILTRSPGPQVEPRRFAPSVPQPDPQPEESARRRERKLVTVLAADLAGAPGDEGAEDPELLHARMDQPLQRISAEVERYGGRLESGVGDMLCAVFGVPAGHEDDPERAVRAALQIQAALSELNRDLAAHRTPGFTLRIGVHTGEALVESDPAGGWRLATLSGGAFQAATRLQAAAEPGQIVVGDAVHEATKELIDYRELARRDRRNGACRAWEALRVGARLGGRRARLGFEARLIGREQELRLLERTLARIEADHRPTLITVLGTAGVGKTRLVRELMERVEALPRTLHWRSGRCPPYAGRSYSALADAIKAECDVHDDDLPAAVEAKVGRALSGMFESRELAPHILSLVGTADRHLSREELFDAWRRFLERLAARNPLVLALEDLHWADAGLLDFIEHLADWGQGPICILTTARPELLESRPGWGGGKRRYVTVDLDPLTPDESDSMVDDLLSGSLPPKARRLVARRGEGNPLFIEEIVRALIDRDVLRAQAGEGWTLTRPLAEVDLPRSIHALIAARLDSLPAAEKAMLQDAAVVGRTFWAGAAARASQRPVDSVREQLGRLRVKELVVTRDSHAFSGEWELAFRHVLIRDVAYESLPKAARAAKHVAVARWAQERAGERGSELAELIASHYSQALAYLEQLEHTGDERAELERQTLRWARAAGRRAMGLSQRAEAARWLKRALEVAEPVGLETAERAALWEAYGDAAQGTAPYAEVMRAYENAHRAYEALRREVDIGRVETSLGNTARQWNDDRVALAWFERSVARLEPLGDSNELARALTELGTAHWRGGRTDEATAVLHAAVRIARAVGTRATEGYALGGRGTALVVTPEWQRGIEDLEQACAIARQVGDLEGLLRWSNNLASALVGNAPDPERTESLLREALERSRRSGRRDWEAWLLSNLGCQAEDQGDVAALEKLGVEVVDVAGSASPSLVCFGLRQQAGAKLLRGELEAAEHLLEQAVDVVGEVEPQELAHIALWRGELALAHGDPQQAVERYFEVIERPGTHLQYDKGPELLGAAARALAALGRTAEAWGLCDRLRAVAAGRAPADACLAWAEGVLREDPRRAAAELLAAATAFERMGRSVLCARCLIDLADAERRLGTDTRPTLARAREILTACGATLYVRAVDEALAAAVG